MTTPAVTCPDCHQPVVVAVDYVTGERVLLDPQPVPGGRVEVKRPPLTRHGWVAIDHITVPAPRQPAFESHTRTCPAPRPTAPVDLSDDPVREQSGGWRR